MRRWAGSVVTSSRKYWGDKLQAAGVLPCGRCGKPITPAMRWQVGHRADRSDGGAFGVINQGIEHARCNESAGGKKGAAITNARRRARSPRVQSERDRGIRGW